jgi:hypothetical protein
MRLIDSRAYHRRLELCFILGVILGCIIGWCWQEARGQYRTERARAGIEGLR